MELIVSNTKKLRGTIRVPGDKSISHRAIMLGSLATGTTKIKGFLVGEDCLSTVRCFRDLGVPISISGDEVKVEGRGLSGLNEPQSFLDVGNSGTTIRLMTGILSAQNFFTTINGDESIRRRPMARVIKPLKEMGACIWGREDNTLAPLAIKGRELKPITYYSPVASAQVKSAVLLAGLFTNGWTEIVEPSLSRNHTELMLEAFGANIKREGNQVAVLGLPKMFGQEVIVPGDISSAAFYIVAGLIAAEGKISIESVGLNPTRDGIIEVLKSMGAKISISDSIVNAGELMGKISVETSELRGVSIGGDIIPRLIDEIPIITVAAVFADGVTEIRDAAELKVKESNRITAMCQGLTNMGARIEELPDGLRIYGGKKLHGAVCESFDDHRIAMSLAIAGLRAEGNTHIKNADSINISFPGFTDVLETLRTGE